jgi:hypothetical protein
MFHYVILATLIGQDNWGRIASGTWSVGEVAPSIDTLPAELIDDLFKLELPSDAEGGASTVQYRDTRYTLALTRLR